MLEQAHATFSELNDFIWRWISGRIPESEAAFEEASRCIDPRVTVISPDGVLEPDGSAWRAIRGAHGVNPEFRIATPRGRTQLLFEDTQLVVAEAFELQRGAKSAARPRHARRLTLLYSKHAGASHDLVLWRLHESYVADDLIGHAEWRELDELDD